MTSSAISDRAQATGTIQGLNHLRFAAALLVFTQHALSCSHLDTWVDIEGFRVGRIGTALFFMLSGFLAARTSRAPSIWLRDRIAFLFPSYWIVTVIGFVLAAVTATKSFDVWQVISQFAGTGYFTHGDHIVNVATWFISPLLLLYLVAATARATSVKIVVPCITAGLTFMVFRHNSENSTVYCHAITFFMAFLVSCAPHGARDKAALIVAGLMTVLAWIHPEFRYGAIASLLLLPALHVQREVACCTAFSKIAYDWFLVHGLCLATVSHLTSSPVLIMTVGAALSIGAATALHRLVQRVTGRVKQKNRVTKHASSSENAAVRPRVSESNGVVSSVPTGPAISVTATMLSASATLRLDDDRDRLVLTSSAQA